MEAENGSSAQGQVHELGAEMGSQAEGQILLLCRERNLELEADKGTPEEGQVRGIRWVEGGNDQDQNKVKYMKSFLVIVLT